MSYGCTALRLLDPTDAARMDTFQAAGHLIPDLRLQCSSILIGYPAWYILPTQRVHCQPCHLNILEAIPCRGTILSNLAVSKVFAVAWFASRHAVEHGPAARFGGAAEEHLGCAGDEAHYGVHVAREARLAHAWVDKVDGDTGL
jgi:hypothetical protein